MWKTAGRGLTRAGVVHLLLLLAAGEWALGVWGAPPGSPLFSGAAAFLRARALGAPATALLLVCQARASACGLRLKAAHLSEAGLERVRAMPRRHSGERVSHGTGTCVTLAAHGTCPTLSSTPLRTGTHTECWAGRVPGPG